MSPTRSQPHLPGRLAVRQAVVAALIGLLMGVAFSAMQVASDYRESAQAEQRDIEQMLAVVREPAAQAGYHLNPEAASVVVQGLLAYGPVREALLRNDFGETLAQGRNPRLAAEADAWWTRFAAPTREYRLPLTQGPAARRVGELVVVTTQGPRVERFLQGVGRDVGFTVLRSLAVALVLGVWFYATLTRPLAALARRIHAGPAPGTAAAEAGRRDEIDEIAAAFERYEREARERAQSLEASAAALAASEQRHRRIVETAGEGVWQVDGAGATTLANEALARMLGSKVVALQGRPMQDFLDDAGRERVALWLAAPKATRGELRFLREDGSALWAEVSICPITEPDGRRAGLLAMVTDATERRQRDDELRASHARLLAMVGDLERHKQDMAHIAELNELLQSARTEAEAFEVIGAIGRRLFAGGTGGLSIAVGDEELQRVSTWGAADWVLPRFGRQACWAIRRGGAHLQGPGDGVRCAQHGPDDGAQRLCTPLVAEGRLLGLLHVSAPQPVDDALRRRAEIFGEVVKLGLSNLRLRDSLRDQALRDALTGLPNRRLFDETLPRELARCLRAGQPLTLAVVDVDDFKHFNDRYGHDTGDRVLRRVAGLLLSNIRSGDLACRYGGDEFLCLLVGSTAAEARARFAGLLAQARAGGDTAADGLPEPVGFSIGLASAPQSGRDAAELLRAADTALYAAKARGGSCVEMAPTGPVPTRPASAA